jgi:hypothetical protein
VLSLCAELGMVAGHTQVIDSALIKANASMGSLELKVPPEQLQACLQQVRTFSQADRRARHDKASLQQRTRSASQQDLLEIRALHRKWRLEQDLRPGGHNKGAKYTSNKTHYSPVDPDARIAVKSGKARKLCYLMQLSVDTSRHVITHVQAAHADQKDSLCLPSLLQGFTQRLQGLGFRCTALLADTGYSSGENYALLEQKGISTFIPPHGTYTGEPQGFTYHKQEDYWLCPQGKKVHFCMELSTVRGNTVRPKLSRLYRTSQKDCKGYPLKQSYIGKQRQKSISITCFRDEYEKTIARVHTHWGRRMKRLRQAIVEPVLGTLLNYMAMRKVNTRGLELAHKCMLLAAMAYNLQKLLRFTPKTSRTAVMALSREEQRTLFWLFFVGGEEEILKGIGIRKYLRVVQQPPVSG